MDRVWELSQSKGAARLVLLALADWADDDGYCYPSLSAIVRKTQLTRPGVLQILRRLKELGEVEVTVRGHDTRDKVKAKVPSHGGWQATNYYRINVGNAVYCPRKRTVDNAVTHQVGNPVTQLPLEEVGNAVSAGSKRHASQVGNADDRTDPVSLNDPSLDPSIEPSEREHTAAAPRLTLDSSAELVTLWNTTREPGPKVSRPAAARLRAYAKALGESRLIADWTLAITWLNGQRHANAPGTGNFPTWRATLDWLTKPGQLAKVLEQARTDIVAPPARPRRPGDLPSDNLTAADVEARAERQRRANEFHEQQEALVAEASALVLAMSDRARAVLEQAVLLELEPFRSRLSASRFDEMVCQALPRELVRHAAGRPLVEVVAELEGQVVAA